MKGLKYLLQEMMSGRLTFYFKAVPMSRKHSLFVDQKNEVLPCFKLKDSTVAVGITYVVYDQPTTSEHSNIWYPIKHLYQGSCVNCLCVLYEPDDIYNVSDIDRYLIVLLQKMANKMELPVFLIYGYPVFESDYFYMIRYIARDRSILIISYANEDEYKLYLKLLLDIDSDDFTFTEFNSINYDEEYKFYSFHRKDDLL